MSLAVGVISMLLDWVLLILPIIAVWKIQLSTARKTGVILVFATGALCVQMTLHVVWDPHWLFQRYGRICNMYLLSGSLSERCIRSILDSLLYQSLDASIPKTSLHRVLSYKHHTEKLSSLLASQLHVCRRHFSSSLGTMCSLPSAHHTLRPS